MLIVLLAWQRFCENISGLFWVVAIFNGNSAFFNQLADPMPVDVDILEQHLEGTHLHEAARRV